MPLDLAQTIPAHCPYGCNGDHESVRPAGDGLFHTFYDQRLRVANDAAGITMTIESFEDGDGIVGRPYLAIRSRGHEVLVPGVPHALELVEALVRAASKLSTEQTSYAVRQAYP